MRVEIEVSVGRRGLDGREGTIATMEIDAAWDGRRDMIDRQKTRQAGKAESGREAS